jgi:crossover junction endodeoxyribonuclease RuvC
VSQTVNNEIQVLGIDPSLRGTGFAILRGSASKPQVVEFGVLKIKPSFSMPECLLQIHDGISGAILRNQPTESAIESTIFVQSYQTAITLGAARGAALLACARHGLVIHEYAPRRIKQAVVGRGAAQKEQVSFMIRALCGLRETPPPDAADAIACAITHLQTLSSRANHSISR